MSEIVIRRGDRLDVPFLRSLLAHAYNWHVAVFDTDISISRYVDGWGRHGDTALIAMEDGHSIGAAWYRLFPESVPGYGFVDPKTPELTIVVVPSRQGEGIGKRLLDALLERAKVGRFPQRLRLGRAGQGGGAVVPRKRLRAGGRAREHARPAAPRLAVGRPAGERLAQPGPELGDEGRVDRVLERRLAVERRRPRRLEPCQRAMREARPG